MQSLRQISQSEFRRAVTPAVLLQLRIMHIALGTGTLLFGAIILYLAAVTNVQETTGESEIFLLSLSLVNVITTAAMVIISRLLFLSRFSDDAMEHMLTKSVPLVSEDGSAAEGAQRCLFAIRQAMILRLALLEAPAYFGLVLCLLAVLNGHGTVHPLYYLNCLSALPFFAVLSRTFPSEERLVEIFNDRIARIS